MKLKKHVCSKCNRVIIKMHNTEFSVCGNKCSGHLVYIKSEDINCDIPPGYKESPSISKIMGL